LQFLISFYHTLRFWTLTTILSIILGIVALLSALFDKSGNTAHNVARLWCRLICQWNGVAVEIRGMKNVLPGQAQIFIANHQGYYDIFALAGYLPVQLRWVAKESLFRIPFVGWSMRAAGYVGVDRRDRKKSYHSFLETTEKVKSGCSIVIFPEGTRSLNGEIGPFKKGSHLLALRTGAPVVPITIIGTWKIIQKGSAVIHPGPVRIIISPPIQINPEISDKGESVLQSIRELICRNYAENDFAPD